MYIKKSVLTGMISLVGGIILLAAAMLFCFSEIEVSRYVYMIIWGICLWLVFALTKKVERL